MTEPKPGKWGLWYVGDTGYATREEALDAIQQQKGQGSPKTESSPIWKLAMFACIATLVGWAGLHWWESGAEDRARDRAREAERRELLAAIEKSRLESLRLCQTTITRLALYGKPSGPGYAQGQEVPGAWVFVWPHGSFHFKNGFGVDVPQWARCEVHMDTGNITSLVVTGKTIIGN